MSVISHAVYEATQILPETVADLHLSLSYKGEDCFYEEHWEGSGDTEGVVVPCGFGITTQTGIQRGTEGDWLLADELENYSIVPKALFELFYKEKND